MSKSGRKPYGYFPDEQAVIEIIKLKARRRKGGAVPGPWVIARELNAEGYKSQKGGPFTGQMVRNILNRKQQPQVKKKQRKKTHLESNDYLSREEIALCRRNGQNPVFETLLLSGLRASELCHLQIRDIAIKRGKSQIDVRRGKGSKGRSVTIGPKLKTILTDHLKARRGAGSKDPVFVNSKGQAIKYWNVYYMVRQIGYNAGIEDLRPHRLRHTFGTFLYHYKKDLFHVKNQLGHKSVSTTEIYAHTPEIEKNMQMAGFENSIDL